MRLLLVKSPLANKTLKNIGFSTVSRARADRISLFNTRRPKGTHYVSGAPLF